MNEFTKEELEYIRNALGPYCGDDSAKYDSYSGYLSGLYTKVSDMIDNYCEHSVSGEVEVFVDICKKCDVLMPRSKTLREYNE